MEFALALQVYATIRYRIPYSQYGYTLMLPVLKEGIHRENIELYISYVLNSADEIIDKYSDKIAYKFPRILDWFSYY